MTTAAIGTTARAYAIRTRNACVSLITSACGSRGRARTVIMTVVRACRLPTIVATPARFTIANTFLGITEAMALAVIWASTLVTRFARVPRVAGACTHAGGTGSMHFTVPDSEGGTVTCWLVGRGCFSATRLSTVTAIALAFAGFTETLAGAGLIVGTASRATLGSTSRASPAAFAVAGKASNTTSRFR